MEKLSIKQIRHDDAILMNLYRDFVVIEDEPRDEKEVESRRKSAENLVQYIENHIYVLEKQVDANDVFSRFEYITNLILFWKNLLLHQFHVFYDTTKIILPAFLGVEQDGSQK